MHDERGAIKGELVLSSNAIEKNQREPRLRCPSPREVLACQVLVELVRASVRNDKQFGPKLRKSGTNGLEPHVLADWHAKLHTSPLDGLRQRPRSEDPLLVEGPVIGQLVLECPADDSAGVGKQHRIEVAPVLINDRANQQGGPGL